MDIVPDASKEDTTMSIMSNESVGSPVQEHPVYIANDLQWIGGDLETLGNPNNYINQEGQEIVTVNDAEIAPWTFTGLPTTQSPKVMIRRSNIQFMVFYGEEALEQFREPPRTTSVILNLPLVIVRGNVPLMSEAKIENFLDFWKGDFIPVSEASLYYLAEAPVELINASELLYVNTRLIQSYVQA
jgi:hypothetical protein